MKITTHGAAPRATLAAMSTRRIVLWAGFVFALVLALANVPRPSEIERQQYRERAGLLEEATVEACRSALRFESPRAKPGLTRVARALPDGGFLVVIPFSVGKLERQARCVGRLDGSLEFDVEVQTL